MANSRTDALKQLVAQNPANSFMRYGLAMEYAKGGELEPAAEEFRVVLRTDSGYLAAYFHFGQVLERLGRLDDARQTYRDGIDVATRLGDAHTRGELESALEILGD